MRTIKQIEDELFELEQELERLKYIRTQQQLKKLQEIVPDVCWYELNLNDIQITELPFQTFYMKKIVINSIRRNQEGDIEFETDLGDGLKWHSESDFYESWYQIMFIEKLDKVTEVLKECGILIERTYEEGHETQRDILLIIVDKYEPLLYEYRTLLAELEIKRQRNGA